MVVNYGPDNYPPLRSAQPVVAQPENSHDVAQDKLYLSALNLVSSLLPHPNSPTASVFDYIPHSTLASLIELSTLPDLLATLLRNDSVPEWHKRSRVYFAMLAVLERLGETESTLGSIFGERRDKKSSEGLREWLCGEGDIVWETKPIVGATTSSKGKKRKLEGGETVVEGEVIYAVP
jgi:baculoviral IAP repeat-containing protein 6